MFTITGDTTSGNATILAVPSTAGIVVGQAISGAGVQAGARVLSFVADTSVTMTLTASATATGETFNIALLNYIGAVPVSSLAATLSLTVVAAAALAMAPTSSLAGSLALNVVTSRALAMQPSSALAGSVGLTINKGNAVTYRPTSVLRGSCALSGIGNSMTLCDVLDVVLGMWGVFNRCSAPDFAKDEAINIINSSLQLVWNNANERSYWSASTLTLTFAAAASSQDLSDSIQNVVGPCRLADTRRPLAPIGTIGELETFADLYLEGDAVTEPVAYYIDRLNQVGNDPAKTVLHVVPAPTVETDFMLEVVLEAPRFSTNDLATCPVVPIPHRYVESLFLPIARYQASTFHLFRKGDQKETIDREYLQARAALGLADPLPGKSGDNKKGPATK